MKTIFSILVCIFIAVCGYIVYLGLIESDNNNIGMIATDTGNLAQSVTDTFKDGVGVLAEHVKEKGIEIKDTMSEKANEIINK